MPRLGIRHPIQRIVQRCRTVYRVMALDGARQA